jgi:hypothetical protein
MRRHILLGLQFGRQFRHRHIRLGIDALERRRQVGCQFPGPRRTALRAGAADPVRDIRSARFTANLGLSSYRRAADRPRPSALYHRLNTLAEVNRTRLSLPGWPHFPARLLNQTSHPLGIPLDSFFKLDAPAPAGSDRHRERPTNNGASFCAEITRGGMMMRGSVLLALRRLTDAEMTVPAILL